MKRLGLAVLLCLCLAVTGCGGGKSAAINPAAAAITVTLTQQFTASVGGAADTTGAWSVNGIMGGNSTIGTISSTGLYTAPKFIPSMNIAVTYTPADGANPGHAGIDLQPSPYAHNFLYTQYDAATQGLTVWTAGPNGENPAKVAIPGGFPAVGIPDPSNPRNTINLPANSAFLAWSPEHMEYLIQGLVWNGQLLLGAPEIGNIGTGSPLSVVPSDQTAHPPYTISPDGSKLLYTTMVSAPTPQHYSTGIVIQDLDGSNLRTIWTANSMSYPEAAWCGNDLIAITDPNDGIIKTIRVDGTGLTSTNTLGSGITCSPDAKHIAFFQWAPNRGPLTLNQSLWVLNLDGGDVQEFAASLSWASGAVWSPDGAWIAWSAGYIISSAGSPVYNGSPVYKVPFPYPSGSLPIPTQVIDNVLDVVWR